MYWQLYFVDNLPSKIQEELKAVNEIPDLLGKGIDDGVKPLVATLRAYGFTTTNSCFGHSEYGYPFVDISSLLATELESSKEYNNLLDEIDSHPDSQSLIDSLNQQTAPAKLKNILEGLRLLELLEQFESESKESGLIISRIGGLSEHRLQTQRGMFIELLDGRGRASALMTLREKFDRFSNFLVENFDENN